ncbi:MAG: hypothetical protein IPK44_15100, partial [Candidatus Accumulibacter sp.]|nr:hypothetical protein [Accumulibacter sp.]
KAPIYECWRDMDVYAARESAGKQPTTTLPLPPQPPGAKKKENLQLLRKLRLKLNLNKKRPTTRKALGGIDWLILRF